MQDQEIPGDTVPDSRPSTGMTANLRAYREASARWRRDNPSATPAETERVNSALFCEMVLHRQTVEGFCRRCQRVHRMTIIPMTSDPSVFRIECRCRSQASP